MRRNMWNVCGRCFKIPIFGKLKRAFLLPSQITNPNNTNFTVYFCFILVLYFSFWDLKFGIYGHLLSGISYFTEKRDGEKDE